MDWDQCDNCGKLGTAGELNELGLCPECAADDNVVARKEQEATGRENSARIMNNPKHQQDIPF